MDPVTALTTVLAVGTAVAQTVTNVHAFIAQIRTAPQAFNDFYAELLHFDGLLDQIKAVLRNTKKVDLVRDKWDSIAPLLVSCQKFLDRFQHEFPSLANNPAGAVSMVQRLKLVLKKDTFIASRAHMQAMSQTLSLLLQKVAIEESLITQDSLGNVQQEIQKLSKGVDGMQQLLTLLFRHASDLETKSERVRQGQEQDLEGETMFEVAQETQVGADLVKKCLQGVQQYSETVVVRAKQLDTGSSVGNRDSLALPKLNLNAAIHTWNDGRLTDEGVDLPSPLQSIRTESEGQRSLAIDSMEHPPAILEAQIRYWLGEYEKNLTNDMLPEARKSLSNARAVYIKRENLHKKPFPSEERKRLEQKMVEIDMQELEKDLQQGTLESCREATKIVDRLLEDHAAEDDELSFRLNHTMALIHMKELELTTFSGQEMDTDDFRIEKLKQAEIRACKSLYGQAELTKPDPHSMRETVRLVVEIYEQKGDESMAHSVSEVYSDYLKRSDSEKEPTFEERRWLERRGFSPDKPNFLATTHEETKMTALITAIRKRDEQSLGMVRKLIKMRADVNARDKSEANNTPMLWAVECNNVAALELLIDARADLTCLDRSGRTPLRLAIERGSLVCIERLAQAAPYLVNQSDDLDMTPLHHAIKRRGSEMITFLGNKGADPNAQDRDGQTPLHMAIGMSSPRMVEKVLSLQPDLTVKNSDGRTPLQEAAVSPGKRSEIYVRISSYESPPSELSPLPRLRRTSGSTSGQGSVSGSLSGPRRTSGSSITKLPPLPALRGASGSSSSNAVPLPDIRKTKTATATNDDTTSELSTVKSLKRIFGSGKKRRASETPI